MEWTYDLSLTYLFQGIVDVISIRIGSNRSSFKSLEQFFYYIVVFLRLKSESIFHKIFLFSYSNAKITTFVGKCKSIILSPDGTEASSLRRAAYGNFFGD
ncbi:MAG: hypothetical protein HDS38_00510 [Bacteroides sp.]|nr:hypothetical protein [Bacteroides sp.]